MKFKYLANAFLSLCLIAQLNFAHAASDYDEEITLPIGTNFDLEMEEITRYEYDGNYVKAQTVNGKEQFILQKLGDTVINVIMEENGQKSEMRVLVHIVSEQQFNGNNTPAAAPNKPATPTSPNKPAVPPAPTTSKKPVAPATPNKPVVPTAPTAPNKPVAPATPANPNITPVLPSGTPAPTNTAPALPSGTPAPETASKPAVQAPAAPAAPAAKYYGKAAQRPNPNVIPMNSIEAANIKNQTMAFQVLDLVNQERAKHGLKNLVMTTDLMEAATVRAQEIPIRFSHMRPNGSRFFTAMLIKGEVQEENIAAGQTTAVAAVRAWLASPASMKIILDPQFTEMGVGYYETYKANYPCYWVQLFRG